MGRFHVAAREDDADAADIGRQFAFEDCRDGDGAGGFDDQMDFGGEPADGEADIVFADEGDGFQVVLEDGKRQFAGGCGAEAVGDGVRASGAMYSGVPLIARSSGSFATPVTSRAMPKSTIFTVSTPARR